MKAKMNNKVPERSHIISLLATFAVLVILDVVITMQVLQKGIGTEAGGVIRLLIQETSLEKAMLIKIVVSFVIIYILYKIWCRKEPVSGLNGKLDSNGASIAYLAIIVIDVMYIFIVLNNILVYTGQIEPIYAVIRTIIEWSKLIL